MATSNLGRDIGLLIFDEAHHAADKHPYNMIRREFYDMYKPRTGILLGPSHEDARPIVLGLAACPMLNGNVRPRRTRNELAMDPLAIAINVSAFSVVVETLDIQKDPSVLALRRKLAKTANLAEAKRVGRRLSLAIDKGEADFAISTAVVVEVIDIRVCGSVIRWIPPQDMVSWT
ncbi:hypothetical protein DFH11DRAFT_1544281 [Phellopilus nigrolimitatus]|nr:hypothetical protein DFH11DRAFT_1544281 [Phellopilus nigrolimitatus]